MFCCLFSRGKLAPCGIGQAMKDSLDYTVSYCVILFHWLFSFVVYD